MVEHIAPAILGIVCIVIGCMNRRGNLSTLHSYHRKRVSEEDRVPFGKLVGLGTILIGVALILTSALYILSSTLQIGVFSIVGTVFLTVGMVFGLGINLYAILKYNKGLL